MIKFIDLDQQYQSMKGEIDAAIARVLAHGQFVMGPEIGKLERQLAKMVGVSHCIAVSSGTTALQVALMALDLKPGDEVITSPFSFFATAEVIALLGATPVYVDINTDTYNIDASKIEAAITERTRAIMPVSLYGQPADMDLINAIAVRHDLPVIEDAAQSLGARYKGRPSGGLSTIGCTSFFPSKPLGCYGDGGACFTDDDEIAATMYSIRNHGQTERYLHTRLGINGRFDSMQAAILLVKLTRFEQEIADRQQVADWYADSLAQKSLRLPIIKPHNMSAYAQYTIEVEDRDTLQQALSQVGVPTTVHYPRGLHQQPVAVQMSPGQESFPITEQAAKRVLSLPFHPYMTQSIVQQVAEKVLMAVTETV